MVVMEMYTGRPTLTDALNDMDWDSCKYVKMKTTSTRNKNWAWVILGTQRTWSMRTWGVLEKSVPFNTTTSHRYEGGTNVKPLLFVLLMLLVLLFVAVAAAGRARDGLVVRVDVRFLGLDVLAAAAAVKRAVISNSRNKKCSILRIVVES
jgi:hypothetical protein